MDCNNFFVSCERLFRPDLKGKPVAVLSSNDGCIVARSQEVKDLGIPMGIPYFQVKDICTKEGVVLFSSNFALYRDISARVMSVLKELTSNVEVYSIDEAFFTGGSSSGLTEDFVRTVREEVVKRVGIPVSIGVAETKTLAKYASSVAKKGSGVYILDAKTWEAEAKNVPCGTIWGIGRQTTEKLRKLNILNVKDIKDIGMSFMRNEFGIAGERLYMELSGISVYEQNPSEDSFQKSIMSTRSFEKNITDLKTLESAVGYHVLHVAEKLRTEESAASKMTVYIRPSRHGAYAHLGHGKVIFLPIPTSDTSVLLKDAVEAVRTLYEKGVPYKKAGVVVSGLIPNEYVPTSLFESPKHRSISAIDTLTDDINKRFGKLTLRPARVMLTAAFAPKLGKRSPRYTTEWTDIASVKA